MKWIPIDHDWPDRGDLPDSHCDVLVSIGDDVYIAFLYKDSWFIEGLGRYDIDDVDAWMPKPKSYNM